jgi:hypothetical protein
MGAAPPCRGSTPAPHPKPVEYSYSFDVGNFQATYEAKFRSTPSKNISFYKLGAIYHAGTCFYWSLASS